MLFAVVDDDDAHSGRATSRHLSSSEKSTRRARLFCTFYILPTHEGRRALLFLLHALHARSFSVMSLSDVDQDRVMELARAAVNKSGNLFFASLLFRTNKILESTVTNVVEEFEQAEALCTSDNLILLSRYYAGEILHPKKRSRRRTLYDQVMDILSNDAASKALNVIFLAAYLEAAQDECEDRAAKAEEAEPFWAQDYADEDPVEMWTRRGEAIDIAKESWDNAAQAATEKDWESFAEHLTDLMEVET